MMLPPEEDYELHGGLSGMLPPDAPFTLEPGVRLGRAFAHVMAPLMVALREPPPGGGHHPGPWTPAGHDSIDIHAAITLAPDYAPPVGVARLSALWVLTALLRIRSRQVDIRMPVIANQPFSTDTEGLRATNIEEWVSGAEPRQILVADLQWIADHWRTTMEIAEANDALGLALKTTDAGATQRDDGLALVMIWAGLERLFDVDQGEVQHKLASRVAAYLEPVGPGRLALFEEVRRLYASRSRAAHGRAQDTSSARRQSFEIAARTLVAIAEEGRVLSGNEFQARVFS